MLVRLMLLFSVRSLPLKLYRIFEESEPLALLILAEVTVLVLLSPTVRLLPVSVNPVILPPEAGVSVTPLAEVAPVL